MAALAACGKYRIAVADALKIIITKNADKSTTILVLAPERHWIFERASDANETYPPKNDVIMFDIPSAKSSRSLLGNAR